MLDNPFLVLSTLFPHVLLTVPGPQPIPSEHKPHPRSFHPPLFNSNALFCSKCSQYRSNLTFNLRPFFSGDLVMVKKPNNRSCGCLKGVKTALTGCACGAVPQTGVWNAERRPLPPAPRSARTHLEVLLPALQLLLQLSDAPRAHQIP